jgi:hypothetical protein
MKSLIGLFSIAMVPIAVLNLAGGIIAGIWLLFAGEWWAVLQGISLGILGPLIISILLAPGMIFAIPISRLLERGQGVLVTILAIPISLWTFLVMAGWATASFWYFVASGTFEYRWSFAVLAYAVAVAPWNYLAQKETQSDPDSMSGFSASMLSLGAAISLFICLVNNGNIELQLVATICLIALILPAVLMVISFATTRRASIDDF